MPDKIYFASDHAGFALKNELLIFVKEELGCETVDCGAFVFDEQDDFTDFIAKAAREVSAHPTSTRAIILGGSGQGEAMLANRFHDVRAVVFYGGNEEIITLSRKHNDANVLSLGARFLNAQSAKQAVALWLKTPHESVEKYDRRIDEIETFAPQVGTVNTSISIAPSLPAASFEEIVSLLEKLEGTASEVQVDIVDGAFVPNRSWPFTETSAEAALGKLQQFTKKFALEIDCMCLSPERFLDLFASMGVKRVVIHLHSTDKLRECIAHAHAHRYKIGFALTNDIPLTDLSPYVPQLDFIQVMGIKNIGTQGEPFDERTLHTIRLLRNLYPSLEIAVDGAVNESTIHELREAGANRFAPGSAITHSSDPVGSYKQLSEMAELV